ncbi:hypothetical protein RFI_15842, partial [Reticulomyxa filosa]
MKKGEEGGQLTKWASEDLSVSKSSGQQWVGIRSTVQPYDDDLSPLSEWIVDEQSNDKGGQSQLGKMNQTKSQQESESEEAGKEEEEEERTDSMECLHIPKTFAIPRVSSPSPRALSDKDQGSTRGGAHLEDLINSIISEAGGAEIKEAVIRYHPAICTSAKLLETIRHMFENAGGWNADDNDSQEEKVQREKTRRFRLIQLVHEWMKKEWDMDFDQKSDTLLQLQLLRQHVCEWCKDNSALQNVLLHKLQIASHSICRSRLHCLVSRTHGYSHSHSHSHADPLTQSQLYTHCSGVSLSSNFLKWQEQFEKERDCTNANGGHDHHDHYDEGNDKRNDCNTAHNAPHTDQRQREQDKKTNIGLSL